MIGEVYRVLENRGSNLMYSSIKRETKYYNYHATTEALGSHIANTLPNTEKNCNVQTCLRLCVWIFFQCTKQSADTDKVANLAQHPKSLGTAGLRLSDKSV